MNIFVFIISVAFSLMSNANPLIVDEGLIRTDGEPPINFYSEGFKDFFTDFSMDAKKIFETIDSTTIEEIIIPNMKDQKLKNELIFISDTKRGCDPTKVYKENEKSSICRSGLDPLWKTIKTIKWHLYVMDGLKTYTVPLFKKYCELKKDCQKDLFREHVLSGDYQTIPSWCSEIDCHFEYLKYRISFLDKNIINPKLEIFNEMVTAFKKNKDIVFVTELFKMQRLFKSKELESCTNVCQAIFELFEYLNGAEIKEAALNKKLKFFKENEFNSMVEFAKMFLMFTKLPFEVSDIEMQKNILFAENLTPNNKFNLLVHLHKFYDHPELAKEIYLNADFVPWPSTKFAISFLLEQNEFCNNIKKCILSPDSEHKLNYEEYEPKIDGIELKHWINKQKSIRDSDVPDVLTYVKAVSSSKLISINKKSQLFSELSTFYDYVSDVHNANIKYSYLKKCAENSNSIESKDDVNIYKLVSRCVSENLNELISKNIDPISNETKIKISELLQNDLGFKRALESNEILKEPELDKNKSVIIKYSNLKSKINFDFIGSVDVDKRNTGGTGFQIDQCHVITAAHVVSAIGEVVKYKYDLLGKQNSLNGVVIASGRKDKMVNNVTQQKDWSVIKLEHNNPLKSKINFGASQSSKNSILTNNIQMAGHQEVEQMIHDSDCRIINISIGGFLETNCFGKPGLSGSPLFIESSKDEYEIIGILSRSINIYIYDEIEKNAILSWAVFLSREKDLFSYNALSEIQKVLKNDPCSI